MSKVILFSTRAIGKENTLWGTECNKYIVKQDDSPIFTYFTREGVSDNEKTELGKLFPQETCFDKIKSHCSQIGIWKDDYENLPEENVLVDLSKNEKVNNDEEFTALLGMYYSQGNQSATDFNLVSLKNYLNNNGCIRFALNIDNPKTDVAIDERFTIYKKSDEHQEYVFIAIWPLARTEKNEENGQNKWISTLVEQICKLVSNCNEIILCLHDKDVADNQPFKVIIPKTKYNNVDLTVAIFQHTPGDPINTILNTPGTDLSKVYNNISAILSNRADMVNAGNAYTTRQVYQEVINNLKKDK